MLAASQIARRTIVLAGVSAAAGALYGTMAGMEAVLPPENGSTCFAGEFTGEESLVRGHHQERRTDAEPVTAIRLRLDRPGGQEPYWDEMVGWGYDWQYDLMLEVATPYRSYHGRGMQCAWSAGLVSRLAPALHCYVECDGGGISLRRVSGRSAVDLVWNAAGWLRMSACGGGGEILRAGSSSKTFRLQRTPCVGVK